jgi:hypothetical protein
MPPLHKQLADQDHLPWWSRNRNKILRPLVILLAAVTLVSLAKVITPAQCWVVFIVASMVAWPIWQHRTEYLLFRRRLVLSGAGQPESRGRALFWKGGITKVIQVVISLTFSWLLLVLVSQLPILHVWVLVVDAILLAMIVGPVTRSLSREIKEQYVAVIARRWPLFLINGTLLTMAFMALDFYVVGSANTLAATWYQLAESEIVERTDASGCFLWGASAGVLAAIESVSWHLSELLIPSIRDVTTQLLLWIFFLIRAAAVAWLFTALLLGVFVILDKWEKRRKDRKSESVVSRSFYLTIIVLAIPFLYVAFKSPHIDLKGQLEGRKVDCDSEEVSRYRLIESLTEEVNRERLSSIQIADARIDERIDRIFEDVEAGVDEYLDWYFTVIGEYQRLAAAFTTDASTAMREKLEKYLFTDSNFIDKIDELEGNVESESSERFVSMGQSLSNQIEGLECDYGEIDLGQLSNINDDKLRASAAVTGGVGAGIAATKVMAQKTTTAVVGKVAAKKSFQAGAALIAKALAKKGTSAALSAGAGFVLCSPTGIAAVLCGITAGVVTWISVDKGLIEIDEALNREEMRSDILEVLEKQKHELGEQLKKKHHNYIDRLAAGVNRFIPSEHGWGP